MLMSVLLFFSKNTVGEENQSSRDGVIIKSDIDTNQYRYLELNNKLKVLLISNANTKKSAAAMHLDVGSVQDPEGNVGLADLVAKSLALGTKKYPKINAYSDIVKQYAGNFGVENFSEAGLTAASLHFFEVENNGLTSVLERFSQLFISPLFPADQLGVQREILAKEYLVEMKKNERPEWAVMEEIMNPLHPTVKILRAKLSGLVKSEFSQQDLMQFYERYYSADKMSLVVSGAQSLDELENQVKLQFSSIPLRELSDANISNPNVSNLGLLNSDRMIEKELLLKPPLFFKTSLAVSVDIKSNGQPKLGFWFPVANPNSDAEKKSYRYIINLLEHEGKGSLNSLLKHLGWAEKIRAAIVLQKENDALFAIDIDLTEKGTLAREQIVSLIFYQLKQIEETLVEDWRYKELQELDDIHFRFQEDWSSLARIKNLAANLAYHQPENVLRGDFYFGNYSQELIKHALSYLNPDNMIWIFSGAKTQSYRISRYGDVPFSLRLGVPARYDIKPNIRKMLFLPEENPFIPKRLSVKTSSMLEEKDQMGPFVPQLIVENKNSHAWFAQNHEFADPRALANFRVQSPSVMASAEGAALVQVFVELLTDKLEEIAYPARQAGIELDVNANMRGFDIRIFGYSNRQGLLINKVIEAITDRYFSEEQFLLKKNKLLFSWRKQYEQEPHWALANHALQINSQPSWSNSELINALEKKSFADFIQFCDRQLIDAKMDALFYGNYFRAEALKLAVVIEYGLLIRQTGRTISGSTYINFPKQQGKPWLYIDHLYQDKTLVGVLLQSPSPRPQDAAHMMLLRHFLQSELASAVKQKKLTSAFFSILPMRLQQIDQTFFFAQSGTENNDKLFVDLEKFLHDQEQSLKEKLSADPQHLLNLQQKLIKELGKPAATLEEQANRYWDAILTKDYSFSRSIQLINAIAQVTPKSLLDYYQTVFTNKSQRVWLSSQPLSNNKDDFNTVMSVSEYQKRLGEMEPR
jgi:insulysin